MELSENARTVLERRIHCARKTAKWWKRLKKCSGRVAEKYPMAEENYDARAPGRVGGEVL